MSAIRFEAKIVLGESIPAELVRERAYGPVYVTAEWPAELATPEVRVALEVRGAPDHRDAPAYAELFFHDAFLLMNLASPGSFDGTIAIAGGDLRMRPLSFSARLFAVARELETIPLRRVTTWWDALAVGTRQIASSAEEVASFELLQLARAEEDEEVAILRLARAAEALLGRTDSLQRLFTLRDEIASGQTPSYHPMHDDALDADVEDATAEWIEVTDHAAILIIRELQKRIRGHAARTT